MEVAMVAGCARRLWRALRVGGIMALASLGLAGGAVTVRRAEATNKRGARLGLVALCCLMALIAAGVTPTAGRAASSVTVSSAGRGSVVICSTALGADGGTCFRYAAHPVQIESGGDGRTVFVNLRWFHWGGGQTTATGILREDSGPAGHPQYSYAKTTMTASRIGSCDSHRAYTNLVIRGVGVPTIHFHGCGLM